MKILTFILSIFLIGNSAIAQKATSNGKSDYMNDGTNLKTSNSSDVIRAIGYKFSTDITDAEPGKGTFRYNNEKIYNVTYIFLDNIDMSGVDQTRWCSTLEDPTGATGREQLIISDDVGNKTVFYISGVFVKESRYWKIPVKFATGKMAIAGKPYYYVYNSLKVKEKGDNTEKERKVVPAKNETEEKKNTGLIAISGVTVASEAGKTNQVVEVTQEQKEAEDKRIAQEQKETEDKRIAQEQKEADDKRIAQQQKENEDKRIAQEQKEADDKRIAQEQKEAEDKRIAQQQKENQETQVNQKKKETQENPGIRSTQTKPTTQTQKVIETDIVPVVNKQVDVNQAVQNKPVNQPVTNNQGVRNNPTTQTNQQRSVNQTPQNKPVIQTVTVTQGVHNNTTNTNQQTNVNQTPQNKPVIQTVTVTQGVHNNTTNTNQQTNVNQTTQNKPVTQTVTVTPGVNNTTTNSNQRTNVNQTTRNKPVTQTVTVTQRKQDTNTNQQRQETNVTTGSTTIIQNQSSQVNQNNRYSYTQNTTSLQNPTHSKCYRGIIEIGYDLGLGSYGISNFKFNFINGFKIGQYASVGLGVGYRHYNYMNANHSDKFLVSSVNQIPIFIDLRTSFSGKKLTPYLAAGIGGSTGTGSGLMQEGLYLTVSGGIWYNLSERLAVFAGLAYDHQRLEFSDTNPFTNNYNKYCNSLGINIGISF